MKHVNFVFAAAIALFIQGTANARVEAEYSGSDYQSGSSAAVLQEVTAAPETAPVALIDSQPVIAPAPVKSAQNSQLAYAPGQELRQDAIANELVAKQPVGEESSLRITPLGGAGDYIGWSSQTRNNYHFGLATEFLTNSPVAIEVEGGYANYSLAYTSVIDAGFANPLVIAHNFDQFNLGANAKVYLSRGTFRPYVGGGLHGVYYKGMKQRMTGDYLREFDEIVGSGQVIAGADVAISKQVGVGVRGSWMVPIFDKPMTRDTADGRNTAPGFEEAALIGASYWKLLGTVSVDL